MLFIYGIGSLINSSVTVGKTIMTRLKINDDENERPKYSKILKKINKNKKMKTNSTIKKDKVPKIL